MIKNIWLSILCIFGLLIIGASQNSINNGSSSGISGASAVAAHKVYGNNTGSTAAADFVRLACADLSDSGAGCTGAGGGGGTGAAVVNVTAVTVSANSTSDQSLMELTLTAGYLNTAAASFKLHASGIQTIGAAQTPTLEYKAKLCTVSGCGSGTVVTLIDITTGASISATNDTWVLGVDLATKTTGATGNLLAKGILSVDIGALPGTAATPYNDIVTATSGNIDLAAALFIDFTVKTSAGSATNSFTQLLGKIDPQVGSSVSSVAGKTGAVTLTLSTDVSGTLQAAQEPAHTGDVTNSAGSLAMTVAAVTGTLATYNGMTKDASNSGVPYIIAKDTATGQTANVAAVTLVASSTAGRYRLTGYITVTTQASSSSTIPVFNLICTDPTDSVAKTTPFPSYTSPGSNPGTSVGKGGGVMCDSKAATAIQYSVSGYASGGATAMAFKYYVILEAL